MTDAFGSIIFPNHAGPVGGPRGGKRIIPDAPIQVSVDHPLNFGPGGGVTHHSVLERTKNTAMERFEHGPPAMAMPNYHAGRPTGIDRPVRHSTGQPRTEYQHPSYQIHRSQQDTGAKELLYSGGGAFGGAAAAPAAAEGSDHALMPVYSHLANVAPTLPRDADGCTDEASMRQLLEAVGLSAISRDGLAELLARCDVSPTGFPPFGDFLLCLSRPHAPQPTASAPTMEHAPLGAIEEAPVAPVAPAAPSVHFDAAVDARPPPSELIRLPTPHVASYAPSNAYADSHQTWRHMQMQKQLALPQAAPYAAAQAAQIARPTRTPVHGIPSTRDFERAEKAQAAAIAALRAKKSIANPQEQLLMNAVAQGSTARLGLEPPRPKGSFPLGARTSIKPLGTNAVDIAKPTHGSSQNFTNSFGPDAFYF